MSARNSQDSPQSGKDRSFSSWFTKPGRNVTPSRESYISQSLYNPSEIGEAVLVQMVPQHEGSSLRHTYVERAETATPSDPGTLGTDEESMFSESQMQLGRLNTIKSGGRPASGVAPDVTLSTAVESVVPPRLRNRPVSEIIGGHAPHTESKGRHRFSLNISDDLDKLMESASNLKHLENPTPHRAAPAVPPTGHLLGHRMLTDSFQTADDESVALAELDRTYSGTLAAVAPLKVPQRPDAEHLERARTVSAQRAEGADDLAPLVAAAGAAGAALAQVHMAEGRFATPEQARMALPVRTEIPGATPGAPNAAEPGVTPLAPVGAPVGASLEVTPHLYSAGGEPRDPTENDPPKSPEATRSPRHSVIAGSIGDSVEGSMEQPAEPQGYVPQHMEFGEMAAGYGPHGTPYEEPQGELATETTPGTAKPTLLLRSEANLRDLMYTQNTRHEDDFYDVEEPVVVHATRAKLVRDSTKVPRAKLGKRRSRRPKRESSSELKPFSYNTLVHLLESINGAVIGEEFETLHLPIKEKQLIEKIIDLLSRLTLDMVLDEHRYEIGLERLEKAHRVLEGFL